MAFCTCLDFLRGARRRNLFIVVAIAAALRVGWAACVPVVPVSDSHAYDVFAWNLAKGLNYGWQQSNPTALWPVGTSFAYSLLYRIFGHSYTPITVFHIVLGVATVLVTALLTEKWFGTRAGITAGFLMAIWPSQIQFTTVLASEPLFLCLVYSALYMWSCGVIRLWLRTLAVGSLVAAASYVRVHALLLPALLAASAVLCHRTRERVAVAAFGMFALIAVLIAPWSIRNTRLFGRFVLISTNGGGVLWMGNNPCSRGGYMQEPEPGGLNEAEHDEHLARIARHYILQRPVGFVGRALRKLVLLNERETIGVVWNKKGLEQKGWDLLLFPLKVTSSAWWLLMLLLGIGGFACVLVAMGQRGLAQPAIALWVYFSGVHVITIAEDRYHFTYIPAIAALAALTVTFLTARHSISWGGVSSAPPRNLCYTTNVRQQSPGARQSK